MDIQLANGRAAGAEKPLFRRRFFLFKKKKPSVAIGSHKDGVPSTQEIEQYLMKMLRLQLYLAVTRNVTTDQKSKVNDQKIELKRVKFASTQLKTTNVTDKLKQLESSY